MLSIDKAVTHGTAVPENYLLYIVLEVQDWAIHYVREAEVLELVRKGRLGNAHYFFPVARLYARLPQVFN